ncbi:helix-turn-helix transcriptional regulator [Bradyrhizobium hipponense]|uniref:Helix-turn-helix transcriptional regulator n=1 Tax=Bradyrhizobium hipponense TaxID=2605638 RepID=A0A5S4YPY4_9BRAD|nr:helix-turn-helix transcriptional regulator [Bradyrhizobium hipponense]TYO65435.1 helix-turn-helix transcriptional regulator [Bradyrhizobium hipponense]
MKQAPAANTKAKQLVIEWIDHILDRKKWNGTDLARAAELAPSTILRLLNNPKHPFVPTVTTLQKIADGSGYPIPKKVMQALGAEGERGDGNGDEADENIRSLGTVRTRQPTVELKHISSLPASLQSTVSAGRDSYVPAPPQLEGDETAFAFHMPDNTFDPWFKSGSLMFATKRRDPVAGDTIVVTDKNGRARVRLLMDITEAGLKLTKTIPATEDEVVSFDDIGDIAIVTIFVKS